MGVGKGPRPPRILKISDKKVVFLVWKNKFHRFWSSPLQKFLRYHLVAPPWKKSFRRPCVIRQNNLLPSLSKQLSHSVSDMGRLHHKSNLSRLRLLATCTITIADKQNRSVIDYGNGYLESNHDYNRDRICLEAFSERRQKTFAWFHVSILYVCWPLNRLQDTIV